MTAVSAPELRKDAIGLREVLFQSITDMAPGAAIAASIPFGAAYAGGSLPLAVVFALVACLFSAVSVSELAGRMPRHLRGARAEPECGVPGRVGVRARRRAHLAARAAATRVHHGGNAARR